MQNRKARFHVTLQLPEYIYHIVREEAFTQHCKRDFYVPEGFERHGFIHCTAGEELTMQTARRIFPGATDLLILRVRLSRLRAVVKFEPAASASGENSVSAKPGGRFAHIYGRLNLDAVEGVTRVIDSDRFPAFP